MAIALLDSVGIIEHAITKIIDNAERAFIVRKKRVITLKMN